MAFFKAGSPKHKENRSMIKKTLPAPLGAVREHAPEKKRKKKVIDMIKKNQIDFRLFRSPKVEEDNMHKKR